MMLVLTLYSLIHSIISLGKEKANVICNKLIICHKWRMPAPAGLRGWTRITHWDLITNHSSTHNPLCCNNSISLSTILSINLAETITWNKGDLKKDVESATHPSPLQAVSDRRKRNKRRVNAAPLFWSCGCWRTCGLNGPPLTSEV